MSLGNVAYLIKGGVKMATKQKTKGKSILNIIGTIGVVLVVVLTILLVGTRIVGIHPYTVLSGSMEPTYHTGSLIYVKSVDPFTLQSG
ncbi:MAG: hypothetical protein J6M22_04640, partial [Firmicutes bacterium]|nr:hypothetical protein [Bacillota bacterium]